MPRSRHFIRSACIAALLMITATGACSDETPAPSPPDNSSATPVPPKNPWSGIDLPKDDSDAAKLLHFDSPQRIHGRFLVEFKSDSELSAAADKLRQFAKEDLPTNGDYANRAAAQVAKQVGGRVVDMIGRVGGVGSGFVFIIEMPDEKALELAKDPRIKLISPDVIVKEAAIQIQTLPSDDSLWHLDRIDQVTLPVGVEHRHRDRAVTHVEGNS